MCTYGRSLFQDMDNAGLRTILNTPVLKEPVKAISANLGRTYFEIPLALYSGQVDFEDKQAKKLGRPFGELGRDCRK